MSFRGAKHPQGVRRIRKAAELPTAAQHPQGVRCIRKAAELPTAAQHPQGVRRIRDGRIPSPRPKAFPWGKVVPQGPDEGGYRGVRRPTGGWGHPPLRRVTINFVGATVPSGPSITGVPPWSPSSVMGCAVVGSFAALRMRRTPCGCCASCNNRTQSLAPPVGELARR